MTLAFLFCKIRGCSDDELLFTFRTNLKKKKIHDVILLIRSVFND